MILINPNPRYYIRYPQLGLLYLAGVLEKENQRVFVIDVFYSYYKSYLQYVENILKPEEPLGFYVNISNLNLVIQITKYFKNKFLNNPIIWGGPFPSTANVDQRVLESVLEYADYGFIGEGESVITEIAKGYDLDNIAGIYYKKDGKYKINSSAPSIADLDTIPFPAWHLVNFNSYIAPTRLPFANMITSRGCPRRCIYCTHTVFGYKLRLRSPINVVNEIEYLFKKFGIKDIHFWDDLFTAYPERVKEICRLIIKEKLHKHIRFALPNGIPADTDDEEMFDLMKRAGFNYITVAIESGVQDIVYKLGKNLDLRKVNSTVQKIRKRGIIVGLYFMLGLPFDDEESLKKTIEFAKSIKAEHAFFWLTLPFPGTKLFDIVEKECRFLSNPYMGYPTYEEGKPVFENKSLKVKTIQYYYKKAYREFYFRPLQFIRTLKSIKRTSLMLIYLIRSAFLILCRGRRL